MNEKVAIHPLETTEYVVAKGDCKFPRRANADSLQTFSMVLTMFLGKRKRVLRKSLSKSEDLKTTPPKLFRVCFRYDEGD